MGDTSPVGHRGHMSPGSQALTQKHSEAQLAQRGHAWAPAGIKDGMGATWGQWRCHPRCDEHCHGVPTALSLTMWAHDEGVWYHARQRAKQQGLKGLGACAGKGRYPAQHPRHPAPCPPPAPEGPWHPGAAGALQCSPCAAELCPLMVRVFQVTPGTGGVSSTGTQRRGISWPMGGSTATTWGQAVGSTRAPLSQAVGPCCDAIGPNVPTVPVLQCSAVPSCAMPCYAWLYCPVPCCAVPGPDMLCLAKLCCALPCHVGSGYAILCYTMPCQGCAVQCQDGSDYAVPCWALQYHARLCCASPCLAVPCQASLRCATPCFAMPRCT